MKNKFSITGLILVLLIVLSFWLKLSQTEEPSFSRNSEREKSILASDVSVLEKSTKKSKTVKRKWAIYNEVEATAEILALEKRILRRGYKLSSHGVDYYNNTDNPISFRDIKELTGFSLKDFKVVEARSEGGVLSWLARDGNLQCLITRGYINPMSRFPNAGERESFILDDRMSWVYPIPEKHENKKLFFKRIWTRCDPADGDYYQEDPNFKLGKDAKLKPYKIPLAEGLPN